MEDLISKIFRMEVSPPEIISDKIVFTNGCFDILHPGHLNYLMEAKKLGDILVVGVNSDSSIAKLKGENRPVNDFTYRSLMLAGYSFIDFVIEFDQDTPLDLIKTIKPYILVKGSDYEIKDIVGADFVVNNGGHVVLLDFVKGYSSTKVIDKINQSLKL
jgi:D-beta-D-heptose 7-phosphate kinase/D-beta-D-heptose 1-phosphate adenosyltransferase